MVKFSSGTLDSVLYLNSFYLSPTSVSPFMASPAFLAMAPHSPSPYFSKNFLVALIKILTASPNFLPASSCSVLLASSEVFSIKTLPSASMFYPAVHGSIQIAVKKPLILLM